MESILKNIGKNVRKYRELRGQTREQLAEILDIDTSYLGQCERGEKQLSIVKTIEIIQYFGLSAEDIIVVPKEINNSEREKYVERINMALDDCTDNQLALILKSVELLKPFIKE